MQTETKTKPAYLGTLNAVALAEADAGRYLKAWAEATPDPDLRCTLELVAARETSHAELMCRRIRELGFELRVKDDPEAEARFRCYASPDVPDIEKVGERRAGGADPFANIEQQLAQGLYDPLTALLMRWYVAEERDSSGLLEGAYDKVRAACERSGGRADGAAGQEAEAIMACMSAGFERLEKAINRLAKSRS